ncbi:hypothetical protein LEP1GSC087_1335 [Leptospira interrogans serovar Bataviae str. L1111]|nr:hypothetical protein LEP1GSC087_1335 [Leptospira interrogans serovar Bataviae str. L1111]EMN65240.1 hypothetical protein LEP1GSC098_4580 [Leptospira interrogans serovar Grippotyphosa str. UI 08434]
MWEFIRKFNDIQTACKNRKYEGFSRNLLHFSKNIWKSYFPSSTSHKRIESLIHFF